MGPHVCRRAMNDRKILTQGCATKCTPFFFEMPYPLQQRMGMVDESAGLPTRVYQSTITSKLVYHHQQTGLPSPADWPTNTSKPVYQHYLSIIKSLSPPYKVWTCMHNPWQEDNWVRTLSNLKETMPLPPCKGVSL